MTKKALEKLNDKQLYYCVTMSMLIDRARVLGLHDENERNRGKLRGFLECMCQSEIISGTELRVLYLYFVSEARRK